MSRSQALEQSWEKRVEHLEAHLLQDFDGGAPRWTVAIVYHGSGPLAWCGHSHRTYAAARHCEASAVDRYVRELKRLEALAQARREEKAHVP